MRIQDIRLDFTMPKKLDVSVAATFDMGIIRLPERHSLLCFSCDDSAGQRWALLDNRSYQRPLEAKMSLAVRPERNQRQYYQTAVLPIGTEIQIRFAAPETSVIGSTPNLPAGGEYAPWTGSDWRLCAGVYGWRYAGAVCDQVWQTAGVVSNHSEFDRKAVELEEAAARERAEQRVSSVRP